MGIRERLVASDGRAKKAEGAEATLRRRLEMLPPGELAMWLDNTVSTTGRSIHNYLRDGKAEDLEEAKIGARSLNAMIEQLERRIPPT